MLMNPRLSLPVRPAQGWPLYTASACAELDRHIIASGTPGFELMQRAAASAWQLIQQRWPQIQRISLLCGSGNNGGDGLLLALLAAQAGLSVRLWLAADPEKYRNEAAQAWQQLVHYGLKPQQGEPDAASLQQDDLLVDALLGIGLQGAVKAALVPWIDAINQAGVPVLALDTPSGLLVDQGQVMGSCVQADATLTFIALKPGLFTGAGADYAGEVWLGDLGVTEPTRWLQPGARLQALTDARSSLAPRLRGGHKGRHGRVLILAGQPGMGGAGILAAQAALRSGAGMVRLLTAAEQVPAALAIQPELLVEAVATDSLASQRQLQAAFDWSDVLLVGPGLGTGVWGQKLWLASHAYRKPMVVDADALNLWAAGWQPPAHPCRIITPHPGEAARLLGMSLAEVNAQRLTSVQQLAQFNAGPALLKGAGSCMQSGADELPWICPFGNPGMGVAGMGDLLAGCLAALLAQGVAPDQALRLAVRIHAQAGDRAAGDLPRGLLPSDLLPELRRGVNA